MLPWRDMLRAALAAGIGPEAFWRLSLREWRWLAGGGGGGAMDRGRLAALMGAYPDGASTAHPGEGRDPEPQGAGHAALDPGLRRGERGRENEDG